MILLIKIILGLFLLAFPVVKIIFKGAVEFNYYPGILFGINYDSYYFVAKIEDEDRTFKLRTVQFHLFCFTSNLAFSIEQFNIEINNEEE